MRKLVAGFAVAALLLVVAGCPNPQQITDLQKQVADAQMKITELEGTMQRLTTERDSLQTVVTELLAKKTTTSGGKTTTGAREALPPTKKTSPK
ncbi:MAG: hypothetical protein R6X12_03440 [bacterium]